MGCFASSSSTPDKFDYSCPPVHNPLKSVIAERRWEVSDLELETVVGEGMFSRVRIAKIKDGPNQTPIALKILQKKDIVKMQQVEHVRQEKDILLRISHPFIVDLLGTFQDPSCLYMMMEFVNGGELHEYIQLQAGTTGVDAGRFFAGEIFLALAYLHSQDIVHRDLKPQNVLLDSTGHVKLTDFGFAKSIPKPEKSFTLVGTPEYVAPEIIQKSGHTFAVDWWAFGIVLFEILLGFTPFCDEDMDQIFAKVLEGDVNCPKHMDPKAQDLINKLLVQDPAKRLGCLKSGSSGIRTHQFFKVSGLDFVELRSRQVTPPHVPSVSGPDDTSMFIKYNNRVSTGSEHISEEDQQLFKRFSSHGDQVVLPPPEFKKRLYPPPKASLATNAPEVVDVSF